MQDALHIAVEHSHRFRECYAGDGCRRVAAYPGEFAPVGRPSRQIAAALMHNSFRRGMKISRAAVVSQSAPGGKYRRLVGGSELVNGGKAAKELPVVFQDRSDPGLLQHDF